MCLTGKESDDTVMCLTKDLSTLYNIKSMNIVSKENLDYYNAWLSYPFIFLLIMLVNIC